MSSPKILALCALLSGVIIVAGCSDTSAPDTTQNSSTAEALAAINSHCPIMGNPVKDNGGRTTWNGDTIGFCCPKCIDEWDSLAEEEKQTQLTNAANHDDGDHGGH